VAFGLMDTKAEAYGWFLHRGMQVRWNGDGAVGWYAHS